MYRPDTSTSFQKVYNERIKKLTGKERFLRGISLTHFCREMCQSGIRDSSPLANSTELKIALFERIYGSSFSRQDKERICSHLRNNP